MTMAARKLTPVTGEHPDDNETIQFNVRIPRFLLRDMDAWLTSINEGRRVGRVSRSDLVRLVLDKACRERPDLDGR